MKAIAKDSEKLEKIRFSLVVSMIIISQASQYRSNFSTLLKG